MYITPREKLRRLILQRGRRIIALPVIRVRRSGRRQRRRRRGNQLGLLLLLRHGLLFCRRIRGEFHGRRWWHRRIGHLLLLLLLLYEAVVVQIFGVFRVGLWRRIAHFGRGLERLLLLTHKNGGCRRIFTVSRRCRVVVVRGGISSGIGEAAEVLFLARLESGQIRFLVSTRPHEMLLLLLCIVCRADIGRS